ncbi:hypothetical protein KC19_2G258600 [Ceratodon purpureus]|uniref:Uncharacterized protein n=1 Tax=Ceratodon purpureus TaxID=3225 RepID=A0A8T0J0A0_CERPU|nr:hypothetical protein KC19_2G258600 [Ceratodon purpureus]
MLFNNPRTIQRCATHCDLILAQPSKTPPSLQLHTIPTLWPKPNLPQPKPTQKQLKNCSKTAQKQLKKCSKPTQTLLTEHTDLTTDNPSTKLRKYRKIMLLDKAMALVPVQEEKIMQLCDPICRVLNKTH